MRAHDNDVLIGECRELMMEIDRAIDRWRFEAVSINEPTAAAGLCRAAQLLDEALDLAQEPPSVGANILVRAAFEYWLIGSWALFGGDDAMVAIETFRIGQELTLARTNRLPPETIEHLLRQQEATRRMKVELLGEETKLSQVVFEQIARRVGKLVEEQTGEHADVITVYDTIYRTHSTYDAHPSKVLGQIVEEDEDGMLRVLKLPPWNSPVDAIGVMAMYLGVLGRWIEATQDGTDESWDERVDAIKVGLDADS